MRKILFLITLIFVLQSCNDKVPQSGSSSTVDAKLNLYQGYLQLYSEFHQSDELSMQTIIMVDNANSDGSLDSNFKTFNYQVTNSDDLDNFIYDIEVPSTGSFLITVTVQGTSCFDNCSSGTGCGFGKGKPYFREAKTFINTDNSPPPTSFSYFYSNPFVTCL